MSQFDVVLQELQAIRDERRTHANTATRVGAAMIDMLRLLGNLDFLPLTGGAMKNSNLVTNLNADLLDGHHAAYFATASAMETLGGTVAGHTSAISTLESYFTGGVANRALRLDSDSPCTAWGQRYWQDGVPQSISGTLDGVENIIMSGVINIGGFVIEKTADGLKFNGNIYATGGVAALGATGASGGGGSAQYLRDLLDVNVSAMSEGQVLTYRNGYWTAEAAQTPSLTAYATKTWVQQQGYLTQHQSLSGYATQQWVNERDFAYNADLSDLANYVQQTYVEKVNGKGLSTNDFTNALLSKLNGIQAGANYYEHPTGGANTTITAASGKVLSAIAVDNLGHVTSVGSKTLAPADIPALDASKITSGTLDTARIPDLSSIYLLKVAGESYPITNSLYIGSVTGRGVFVKDPAGNYVPAFYQNGENLWIGSTQTLDTHHRGQTYISAGYDGQHGNTTIYVCVPNDANNGGTNYGVWHSGNDGSGSGLDADLLDGHDSGYFATASALTTLAGTVSAQGGRITTLEGYFDNGVANSAKRLSGTNTYTAWGQTYWQNGVPKSISGAMTSVDSINALAYFSSSRVGIGKSTPSRKLHVYDSNRLLMRLEASNSRYVDLGVDDDGLNIETGNTTNSVWVNGNVIISSGDIDVQDGVIKIGGGTISWNSDGEYFEFSHTIASLGGVSALGTSGTGGGGTITTQYLRELLDVNIGSSITAGHVLTYRNGYWVPEATQVPSLTDYALKTWVQQQGYLTQHQSLAAYATTQYVSQQINSAMSYVESNFVYRFDFQDLASNTVTALSTSGDYLTWTRNGATNNLTVPFATDSKALRNFFDSRPASANNQYGDGKLRHYMATSSMTTGKPPVDAHIIHSAWDYNNGYDVQLAIGNANSGLFFRTQSQGTWQAWKQVAILDNLSGYLPLSAGSGKPLTGELYISGSHGIQWNNGEGMLVCRPTAGGWAGVSETQWAVGALTAQGVIRSDANDLLHCRSNTAYKVWDAYNFNPGNYLPLTGGTLKGDLVLGNQNNTTNDDSAKIAFRTNDTYPNISPYIQAINEASYGRKRLSVFQKNAGDWSSPQVEVLSVMPDGKLRLTQAISYKGAKATYDMITFLDNASDIYGNGIAIGGGGTTIIGGGESAATIAAQISNGGGELMYIGNDQGVSIFTNLQNGWDYRKEFTFYNTGVLSTAGSVITPNGSGLYIEDTGGTERMAVFVNGSNQFFVGFGMRNAGYTGYFDSYVMHLRSGASGTTMTLDANNRVGIGTTAPDYKLDVAGAAHLTGDASGYGLILDNDKAVTLKDSGGTLHRALFLNSGNLLSLGYGTTRNSGLHTELCGRTITFKTGSGSGTDPDERVRITETGNVGIGTASPQHRLHVAGNIVATGAVAALGVSAQGTAIGAIAADTLTVSQSAVIGGAATVGGRLSVAMSAAVRGNVELQDGSTIYWGGTMGDDPAIYMSDGHIYARAGGGHTVQLV